MFEKKMSRAAKLIDLKSFGATKSFPAFCVLDDGGREIGTHLFTLSPKLMQWSEGLWIIQLECCRIFWEGEAKKKGVDWLTLFETVLKKTFKTQNYRCVFADHPWPALVFMHFLKEKQAQGLYPLQSLFNQKHYQHLSWESWFSPLAQLAKHLSHLKIKDFRPGPFRAKQSQMQRFIDRMSLSGPFDLKEADATEIGRRFSGWLGRVWQWTFHKTDTQKEKQRQLFSAFESAKALQDFPWHPFEMQNPPRIARHLDDPLTLWAALEPLLQDDLHKLCLSDAWGHPQEQVTEITWSLNLYNLKTIDLLLSFRHPYPLHSDEQTGFKTALHQAYYVYCDFIMASKKRGEDLDLPEQIPLIGWSIAVSGRISITPQILSLIPNQNAEPEMSPLLALQNKLPLQITSYALTNNFDPIQSFASRIIGNNQQQDFPDNLWRAAAIKRPLFYYPEPKTMPSPSRPKPIFLERTAISWWENEDLQETIKDYFLVDNKQGHRIWAYRDHLGQWYQHGIYT